MTRLTLIILFLPLIGFGQDAKYRLQTSFGFHSTMYGGTRSFENASRNGGAENFNYYENEYYNIDYENSAFSAGFNFRLSLNWINDKHYLIRQSSAIFMDIYEDRITYSLTSYTHGDTAIYPYGNYAQVPQLGESQLATFNGIGWGAQHELLYLYKFDNGWNLGGGLSYNWIRRNDAHYKYSWDVYSPNHTRLSFGTYTTKQLGLVAHLEKVYSQWLVYFKLNQSFVTIKSQKGPDYTSQQSVLPLSLNLDYRFPLMIQFGAAFQFKKLKN